jgi:hypothetical protein
MPPQQAMPQAQMQLPEDQGIAQLPAPNMQGMADGGIAGYAVGGAPSSASFGEFLRTQGVNPPDFSRLPSAAQETLKRLFSNATAGPQMATAAPTSAPVSPAAAAAAEQPGLAYRMGQSVAQGVKRVGDFISEGSPRLGVGLAALLTPSNEGQDTREDEMLAAVRGEGYKGKPYNKEAAAALLKEMGLDPARAPDKAAPAVKPAALASTGADQGRGKSGGPSEKELIAAGKATAGADTAKTDSGLQSLLKTSAGTSTSQAGAPETDPTKIAAEYAKVRDAYTPVNRFSKEIGEMTDAEAAMLEQNKKQLLADIAKRGPAMAGYETRLKGREERLSKQEADLSGMSIMEAGLAMMAGTSPHALTNIGAGAQSGVKSYKAGLEKLSEARDKLDDSFAKVEELRRSEGMLNDKEVRQATKDIAQTKVKAKELTLSAVMEDGKLGRKEAEMAFNVMATNRKAVFEQEQQTKRSGMEQAGANARAV